MIASFVSSRFSLANDIHSSTQDDTVAAVEQNGKRIVAARL